MLWEFIDRRAYFKLSEKGTDTSKKSLDGILRIVDLDHGFIEILVGEYRVQITSVPEKFYNLLGTFLNSQVIVEASLDGRGVYHFQNIYGSK